MIKAKVPENEEKRLKELKEYGVLDTVPEQDFDDLTKIASHICQTPIALISLVDESRQWFKAKVGLDAQETSRDLAFCAHAILQDDAFIVSDSFEDERFCDNPLVTGFPNVRFYAGAPLKVPSGENIGTLCVIDNKPRELEPSQIEALEALSRQVISQMELRLARVKAENANVSKSTFLADMSHELRTPLNAIVGYSELLIEETEGSDLGHFTRDVKKIKMAGTHLLELINQILDLSKVESGKMEVHYDDFLPKDLSAEIQTLVEPIVRFNNNVLERSSSIPDETLLRTDRGKLKQVIINLIANAAKFTEDGQISLTMSLEHEWLTVSVEDTGVGMEPAVLEKIFEQFAQASPTTSAVYGGTGLGLCISKNFCELLGGYISATSQVGVGSKFLCKIPVDVKTT